MSAPDAGNSAVKLRLCSCSSEQAVGLKPDLPVGSFFFLPLCLGDSCKLEVAPHRVSELTSTILCSFISVLLHKRMKHFLHSNISNFNVLNIIFTSGDGPNI